MASKKIKVTTPIAPFAWPFIDRPSPPYKGKGPDVYRVELVFEPDDPQLLAFEEQLRQYGERRRVELGYPDDVVVRLPIVDQMEKVEGKAKKQPTGKRIIRAKMAAEFKPHPDRPPVPQRPEILDAQMNRMIDDKGNAPAIGAGSKGRVAGTASAIYIEKDAELYVTIYMDGVQVVDLVAPNRFRTDDYDLSEVDGGYTTPQTVEVGDAEEGDF